MSNNEQLQPILEDLHAKKKSLDYTIYAFYFEGVKQTIRLFHAESGMYTHFLTQTKEAKLFPEFHD